MTPAVAGMRGPEIPGFRWVRPLGQGGFADVFLYRQELPSREVAIKVVRTQGDERGTKELHREADAMTLLAGHPAVVELHGVGTTADGRAYLVMEYCPVADLLTQVRARPMALEKALETMIKVCGGVEMFHRQGYVHRDIKPSNLILQSGGIIRLIDFDAARTVKEHSGEDTMHLGTRGYAPPEQFGYGQTDARSDIYSIGITMRKVLPQEYCGYLVKIFAKCTEIDPNRRYRNLQELRRALIFRRFWAGRGKPALWTLAIVSVVVFCLLPRLDGTEPLPSAPASKSEVDSPDIRLPSAAEKSAAEPAPETSDERFSVQSLVPSDSESEQEVAVPTPTSSIEPTAHDSYMPPTASQEERKSIKNVDVFMEEFKDEPEKLAYWQTRNANASTDNTSEVERLEAMKRGELGLRVDAFIKNLPPMTEAERNRAIDEFVAEQKRLLDL